MAIDFPNGPTAGDEFTPPGGGPTWIYDGVKWTTAANTSGRYLPLSGGTMTGPIRDLVGEAQIVVEGVGAAGHASVRINKADSGSVANLVGMRDGSNRWVINLGEGAAETGGNTGSNFSIDRYADDGATGIGSALIIERATGNAAFGHRLSCDTSAANIVYFTNPPAQFYSDSGGQLRAHCWRASDYGMQWDNSNGQTTWYGEVAVGVVINGMTIDGGGTFTVAGNASKPTGEMWINTSDARIKTVRGDYDKGLDEVLALRPVAYTYKGNDTPTADPTPTILDHGEAKAAPHVGGAPYPASPNYLAAMEQAPHVGVVAQEVEAIFPNMVNKRAGFIDGQAVNDLRELNASELLWALVNSVKTLAARVEALEAQLAAPAHRGGH